ncbi:hypothetical protein SDC9_124237 [bioreactor metagenome]|uniref:Uncharacterized protein n=1 Tax=bioreactor metagenome TaxID=1076179 RepID=A0A645CJV8_9ZZZZ
MAGKDVTYPVLVLVQRVVQGKDCPAGEAKHGVNTLLRQTLYDDLGSGHLHGRYSSS